jgi:hypothetical protein
LKYTLILLLFLTLGTLMAQKLRREDIREKGIRKVRVYSIAIKDEEYEKPLYTKDNLAYEYTYDTSGREIAFYHFYHSMVNSGEYITRIDKDSIFSFDDQDRPLLRKSFSVDKFQTMSYYILSRTILLQKYLYNDVSGVNKITSLYENGKIASIEYLYNEPLKKTTVTYKTGSEKFERGKKLIEKDISVYDSSGKFRMREKYEVRHGREEYLCERYYYDSNGAWTYTQELDKKGKIISTQTKYLNGTTQKWNDVYVDVKADTIKVIEEYTYNRSIPDSNGYKKYQPFSFICRYHDSIEFHVEVRPYAYASYSSTPQESILYVSCYKNNLLYESKQVVIEIVPDTNHLTEEFMEKLLYYKRNIGDWRVTNIRKYNSNGVVNFILKYNNSDEHYNILYEYEYYDPQGGEKILTMTIRE